LIFCETRGGFHASFGRGDPCTRYQAQSCAQRTTLLSVAYKIDSRSRFHCLGARELLSPLPVSKGEDEGEGRVRVSRSAPLITRLARSVAGEAAPERG
jgi:hypothetical protein